LAVAESIRTQAKRLFSSMALSAPTSQPASHVDAATTTIPTSAVTEDAALAAYPLTLSLGIGTLTPDHKQVPESLLLGARRALERAQRNGGDRVDLDGVN
jgi:GGDEF domain-containing protein